MKFLLSVAIILFTNISQGQKIRNIKNHFVSLAVSNNHPDKPFGAFTKLAYKNFHPGIEFGTGFSWKVKNHHELIQTVSVGYFYHQWIQHAIMLQTSFGYQYDFSNRTNMNITLGAGYLHSVNDGKVFVLQEGGEYVEKKNRGRSQLIASFGIGISQSITARVDLFSEYKQKFQFPFINEYVPILPYNSLSLGIKYQLN